MATFGIDLGTTFSCIARFDEEHERVEVLNNTEGRNITPSVVFVKDDDNFAVGETALNQLKGPNARKVIAFAKRLLADDSLCEKNQFDEYPNFKGEKLNPTTVSSMVLKKLTGLNENVQNIVKGEPINVVITFPAYFSQSARQRTREAGENAGLNVIGMIEEPIAAALSYGFGEKTRNKTVLVYDLGGGTFDITVIRFGDDGAPVVLKKDGDPMKGGVDWDNHFGFHLWQKYIKDNPQDIVLSLDDFITPQADDLAKLRKINAFRSFAQKAKHELTTLDSVDVECDGDGNLVSATLEEFNDVTSDLLNSTLGPVGDLISDVGDIDQVLLVGGSSRMRQVRAGLEREFPQFVGKIEMCDPDQAVAKGAAIYAAAQKFKSDNGGACANLAVPKGLSIGASFSNISSKSYGVSCYRFDDAFIVSNLINVGDKLPAVGEETFYTRNEGQTSISVDVYESDLKNEIRSDGQNMGIMLESAKKVSEDAHADFNRPVPKGTPVSVRFELNEAGELHIVAKPQGGQVLDFKLQLKGTGKGNRI